MFSYSTDKMGSIVAVVTANYKCCQIVVTSPAQATASQAIMEVSSVI